MYNSKKILTGAFLALAVTATATGTAFAKENLSANVQTDVSAGSRGFFGNLINDLKADVRLNAERRQEHRDDRRADRQEHRSDKTNTNTADRADEHDSAKLRANGTVTAVNDDSYTIDTKHQGEVTVDIDSGTQVKDGVLADIMVGTKIHVKGMWDSMKEAFVAAKVRILG